MPNAILTRAIEALCQGDHLTADHTSAALEEVMQGRSGEVQTAAFLVALSLPVFGMHTKLLGFDDLPRGLKIVQTYRTVQAAFPGASAPATVVVQAPDGQTVTAPENAAAVAALVGELGRLPGVVSASNPLDPAAPAVNADQTTAYSTVTYGAGAGEVPPEQQDALLAAVADAGQGGLVVEVTGEAAQAPPHVGGPAEHGFQFVGRRGIEEIDGGEFHARDFVHLENVDADDAARRADPLGRHLAPAAGRCATCGR